MIGIDAQDEELQISKDWLFVAREDGKKAVCIAPFDMEYLNLIQVYDLGLFLNKQKQSVRMWIFSFFLDKLQLPDGGFVWNWTSQWKLTNIEPIHLDDSIHTFGILSIWCKSSIVLWGSKCHNVHLMETFNAFGEFKKCAASQHVCLKAIIKAVIYNGLGLNKMRIYWVRQ